MFKIDKDKYIHITRGDVGSIEVSAISEDNSVYVFSSGDIVRLQVMKPKDCSAVLLKKVVTVGEESETVTIFLDSADTRIGEIINKPEKYWYEIELNPDTNDQTIIGYDEDGPKLFILYPEGVDI